MILDKDHALVNRLLESTRNRKTEWLPTAMSNEFTTSFSGKFGVVIGADEGRHDAWLVITDAGGTILHRLTDEYNANIYELFELARRNALHVDEAIDSILGELGEATASEPEAGPEVTDEDIPF
jgi:hypothetical protein